MKAIIDIAQAILFESLIWTVIICSFAFFVATRRVRPRRQKRK